MKKNLLQTGLLFLVAILFVTFYSFSTSPLYVNEGYDSGVFKSMGFAITQGKIPYVDFFDHKGPVLYFINALGQWLIPGRLGIFFLQIIATSISFIFLFKTARLFLNGVASICVMAVTLYLLGGLYQEGNQCEEWILAIVSPCVYFLLSDIVRGELKHTSPLYGFLYGVCFGLAFFVRPNDALAILGGILLGAIGYAWFVMKETKLRILYDVLAFMGGFVVVCIPIYVYFSYHHAFDDFIYGLFIHNSLYSNGIMGVFISYRKVAYLLLWLVVGYMIWYTRYKEILFVIIPVCVFQFLMMGTRILAHYMIDYIFLFLLMGAFLIKRADVRSLLLYGVILYGIMLVGRVNVFRKAEDAILERVKMIYTHDADNRAFYAESDKLLNLVPADKVDSIWNYNVTWSNVNYPYSSIFLHQGIIQCNRVPHYPMYYVSEKLKNEDDIKKYAPPYVVLTHSNDIDTINQPSWASFNIDYKYIDKNYDLLAETDHNICDIELYKRKN